MDMKVKFTLKQWRNVRGFSRERLADMVGKDVSTIQAWEKRGAPPKYEDIRKLEEVLNINWADDVCMP